MEKDTQKINSTISDSLQLFISSGELQKLVIEIEKKYKLSETESRVIQEQIIGFLFSLISLDDVLTEITLVLRHKNEESISEIVYFIQNNILIKRV